MTLVVDLPAFQSPLRHLEPSHRSDPIERCTPARPSSRPLGWFRSRSVRVFGSVITGVLTLAGCARSNADQPDIASPPVFTVQTADVRNGVTERVTFEPPADSASVAGHRPSFTVERIPPDGHHFADGRDAGWTIRVSYDDATENAQHHALQGTPPELKPSREIERVIQGLEPIDDVGEFGLGAPGGTSHSAQRFACAAPFTSAEMIAVTEIPQSDDPDAAEHTQHRVQRTAVFELGLSLDQAVPGCGPIRVKSAAGLGTPS